MSYPFQRVFLIVLDSVGIGEAPDAHLFGDKGADTLGSIAETVGLHLPTMEKLGLSHIKALPGMEKVASPLAHVGIMEEASKSKDTLTGHWELMGLYIDEPFQTFPGGFPKELIDRIEKRTGRKVLGNKVASGTRIIEELGPTHLETGGLIVYTSADSVLQIAAHEEVIPLSELYDICHMVRKWTTDRPYKIGRVIARPFIGTPGAFERTSHRQDYALKPVDKTVLDGLEEHGLDTIAVGKIHDIFHGEGITKSIRTSSNDDGMEKIIQSLNQSFTGLLFANLVDFDSKYGHRRDPKGYRDALERFDAKLPTIIEGLSKDDLLIITADHGNDPTFKGTDHTRELVPLIVYHSRIETSKHLGRRKTFADVGATIAENFHVQAPSYGESFLSFVLD
ncbi:phosphopentomutase [Aliibacillus thermotolerans]|uniref:Phosphopentomutase n=1 Tax=Aliibacillus thermotolerans TaxID=1834418 RepID=A0ABW0U6D1_9BACI|nr:phosphopentomutase [Aliibacillus thermotolerans]MDA3128616.1 phosphopentomutase [Aliibacillus thermotolerans]